MKQHQRVPSETIVVPLYSKEAMTTAMAARALVPAAALEVRAPLALEPVGVDPAPLPVVLPLEPVFPVIEKGPMGRPASVQLSA
jgi:hypothetical protein